MAEVDTSESPERKAAAAARKEAMTRDRSLYVDQFVERVSVLEGVIRIVNVETPDDFFVWITTEDSPRENISAEVRKISKEVCEEKPSIDLIGTTPVVSEGTFRGYLETFANDSEQRRKATVLYPQPQN